MNKILTVYLFNRKQNSNLVVLGLIAVSLILLRVKLMHEIYLLFLIWNLLLGYLPYLLSFEMKSTVPGTFKFYLLFFGWLLFLPNSFYLLTDFKHLHHNSNLQLLYDTLLFSSFSIAGFYAGIASLLHINWLLEMKYSINKSKFIIAVFCYLSGFGVYLGRMLRFNSWDILSNPLKLLLTIIKSTLSFEAYQFSFLFGTFIMTIYIISYLIINLKNKS